MSILLAALLLGRFQPAAGQDTYQQDWEELPIIQKTPGYHPFLRLNAGGTFKFATPYYVADGKYQESDGHVTLTPDMAVQINRADVNKLVEGLDPKTRAAQVDAYNKSLAQFDGNYSEDRQTLTISYQIGPKTAKFDLHPITYGDESRPSLVSGAETGIPGVWIAPEPYPDRLDSKTRYRIDGLDGLRRFSREAMASDTAQFTVFDFRTDHTFRIHASEKRWELQGRTVVLHMDPGELRLELSSDNSSLLLGGKKFLTRRY